MSDLVERLDAVITELENAAREAKWSGEWRSTRNNDMPLVCADVTLVNSEGEFLEYVATDVERSTAVHIALHDPETELRRCAAERKTLALHRVEEPEQDRLRGFCAHCGWRFPCPDVRNLAEGYGITEEANT